MELRVSHDITLGDGWKAPHMGQGRLVKHKDKTVKLCPCHLPSLQVLAILSHTGNAKTMVMTALDKLKRAHTCAFRVKEHTWCLPC